MFQKKYENNRKKLRADGNRASHPRYAKEQRPINRQQIL